MVECVVLSAISFMFLMMRCSGYARASRMPLRLLSSSCRMWSSEIIMLYRSAWEYMMPSLQTGGR